KSHLKDEYYARLIRANPIQGQTGKFRADPISPCQSGLSDFHHNDVAKQITHRLPLGCKLPVFMV
ncbi:MAG: hypothetical protein KC545_11970, partial [Nitrospira sp.]|nr:hypothetical protein [Nitrospira sp.]